MSEAKTTRRRRTRRTANRKDTPVEAVTEEAVTEEAETADIATAVVVDPETIVQELVTPTDDEGVPGFLADAEAAQALEAELDAATAEVVDELAVDDSPTPHDTGASAPDNVPLAPVTTPAETALTFNQLRRIDRWLADSRDQLAGLDDLGQIARFAESSLNMDIVGAHDIQFLIDNGDGDLDWLLPASREDKLARAVKDLLVMVGRTLEIDGQTAIGPADVDKLRGFAALVRDV